MAKLRVLSGCEVLKILHHFGFQDIAQRGSHIKVRRVLAGGRTETLTVPNHDEIDRGALQPYTVRHADSFRSPNFVPGFSRTECGIPGRSSKVVQCGEPLKIVISNVPAVDPNSTLELAVHW